MNQEEKQVILQRLEIMKNNQDIRWIQRYENYQKALLQLREALELKKERALSRLEKQGTIQAFEFTHELARQE
jgi:DNA-binding transcriptional MocR family regulator